MKPVIVFGVVFSTILCGTLASRLVLTDKDAPGGTRSWVSAGPQATAVVHIPGATTFGSGEGAALRAIAGHLDAAPDAPVAVDWIERYHGRSLQLRALYSPRDCTLRCARGDGDDYSYDPVTPTGIRTSLRDGEEAPFANANLFSQWQVAAR